MPANNDTAGRPPKAAKRTVQRLSAPKKGSGGGRRGRSASPFRGKTKESSHLPEVPGTAILDTKSGGDDLRTQSQPINEPDDDEWGELDGRPPEMPGCEVLTDVRRGSAPLEDVRDASMLSRARAAKIGASFDTKRNATSQLQLVSKESRLGRLSSKMEAAPDPKNKAALTNIQPASAPGSPRNSPRSARSKKVAPSTVSRTGSRGRTLRGSPGSYRRPRRAESNDVIRHDTTKPPRRTLGAPGAGVRRQSSIKQSSATRSHGQSVSRVGKRLNKQESQSLRQNFGKLNLAGLKQSEQDKLSARGKRKEMAPVKNPHKVEKLEEKTLDMDLLSASDLFNKDKFTFIKILGQGTYGVVRLVRSRNNHALYALKILRKRQQIEEDEVDHVINESWIMAHVDHAFIVKHYASLQDESKLYILMEYVAGCDLYLYIKETDGFKDSLILFFAAQIVLIIEYLHSEGIVYRDLKPENLLVDWQGYLKLTDFSFAKDIEKSRTDTFCGTPCYIAPEIILQEGHGLCVDWWSVGILIYEMAAGYLPFDNEDVVTLYDDILKKEPRFDQRFSLQAQSLVTELLLKDPNHRLGSRGSQEVKSHPYFKSVDWGALQARRTKSPLPMFMIDAIAHSLSVDVGESSVVDHQPLTSEEQKLFANFGSKR